MKSKSVIKYPQIPRDERKSVKLKTKDTANIRILNNMGVTVKDLAILYNVSNTTIRYWVSDKVRNKMIKQATKWHKDNWENDKDFRKKMIKKANGWAKERKKKDSKFDAYSKTISLKYTSEHTRSKEQIENTKRKNKGKYATFTEEELFKRFITRQRIRRAKTLAGWRQFWKRIEARVWILYEK